MSTFDETVKSRHSGEGRNPGKRSSFKKLDSGLRRNDGTGKSRFSGPKLTTGGGWMIRWKSILALVMIGVGFVFDLYWIWGILFLIWAINDLRNRSTYLLDYIPRSDAPILYWIIVLMWLFLGIWTLTFSPAYYGLANGTEEVRQHIDAGKKSIEKSLSETESRTLKNERFGFSVTKPKAWKVDEQSDSYSVTVNIEDPKQAGSITVIAMDLQKRFLLEDFIPYMESEISKELFFVKTDRRTKSDDPLQLEESAGIAMTFHEYVGDYQGYKVETLIGYGVKGLRGVTLIGMYGASDRNMETSIYDAFRSFRLSDDVMGSSKH